MSDDSISRQAAIDALAKGFWGVDWDKALAEAIIKDLPSAQSQTVIDQLRWERDIAVKQLHDLGYEFGEEVKDAHPGDIARDIATIIENEKDMRVMLQQQWIPVTKEEMFKAGYEGREIRFRVDGRLFAIRELAQ